MRSMKKWIPFISTVAVAVVGLSMGVYFRYEPQRKAKAELETMIEYAQRQALEIAIIEQASKLTNYRKQLAQTQQPVAAPVISPVADPKDVEINGERNEE